MNQIGNKLLTGIKLTAKWWLIQLLFYIIYAQIDYAFEQLIFGWHYRGDWESWGLWIGVALNTVLFAFWHAFLIRNASGGLSSFLGSFCWY